MLFRSVTGVLHLFAPQMMMQAANIALTSANHHHVIRAAYGGAYIGIAALFLAGALWPAQRSASLISVAILFCGFAIGRLYSIAVDGLPATLYLGVLGANVGSLANGVAPAAEAAPAR